MAPCVGGVVLSNRSLDDTVLEHEDVHRQQWRRYGLLFIPMYFAAGIDPLQYRFEIEADLVEGGYVKAPVKRLPKCLAFRWISAESACPQQAFG